MEDLHTSVSEIFGRLGSSLKKRKGTEIAGSLGELFDELKEQVTHQPMQALSLGVAIGYVLARVLQGRGASIAPRLIAKGIGSIAAISFLEYVSKDIPEGDVPDYRH